MQSVADKGAALLRRSSPMSTSLARWPPQQSTSVLSAPAEQLMFQMRAHRHPLAETHLRPRWNDCSTDMQSARKALPGIACTAATCNAYNSAPWIGFHTGRGHAMRRGHDDTIRIDCDGSPIEAAAKATIQRKPVEKGPVHLDGPAERA
jgi:hypothetical protein